MAGCRPQGHAVCFTLTGGCHARHLFDPFDSLRRRPDLRPGEAAGARGSGLRHLAAAVFDAHPARESAPAGRRLGGDRERHRGGGELGSAGDAVGRDRLHARPGAAAGLHRRAGGGRSGGDARRDGGDGRRCREDQPAAAGGAGDRPLGAGRRVRLGCRLPPQRRTRVRAQSRALRLPQVGAAGVRQLQGGAAWHRDLPPGESRVPGAGGDGDPRRRRAVPARLPGHAGRY